MSFTEEQKTEIKTAFRKWVNARREFEPHRSDEFKQIMIQMDPDIWHSSLLDRLLDGKEPLPKPPPRSYSYPNYSLGEGREEYFGNGSDDRIFWESIPGKVLIMQSVYDLVSTTDTATPQPPPRALTSGILIVRWAETGELFRVETGDFHWWYSEPHDCAKAACHWKYRMKKVE